jgi:hypothetical protein
MVSAPGICPRAQDFARPGPGALCAPVCAPLETLDTATLGILTRGEGWDLISLTDIGGAGCLRPLTGAPPQADF